MNRISGFYDWICELADNSYSCVDYSDMKDLNNMIIVSVIEEERLRTFLSGLLQVNPDISLSIIVQDYVYEGFVKSFGNRGCIIPWHGPYTLDLFNLILTSIDKNIDSFTFFSDFPANLRDKNFLDIACALNDVKSISLYNCTIGNDIYSYKDINKFKMILDCYESVNLLVNKCLE